MTQSLSECLKYSEGYKAYLRHLRRRDQRIANLRSQGRHGEADLMILDDAHRLPSATRQAYITRYNHQKSTV